MGRRDIEDNATAPASVFVLMDYAETSRALRARAVGAAMHCYSCGDPGWEYRREAPSRQIIQFVHGKS